MRLLILLPFLLLSLSLQAQGTFRFPALGFSIDTPANWLRLNKEETIENLSNYELTEEQLREMLRLHNGAIYVLTLSKRDPAQYFGILPTIKIRARASSTTELGKLMVSMKTSMEDALKTFRDFRYEEPFAIVDLAGLKMIKAVFTYSLRVEGKEYSTRTFTYVILRKGYYLQLSFSDSGSKGEDESKLFDQLIRSVGFRPAK